MIRSSDGQVLVIFALFLPFVLIPMAGMVLDVGAAYRADRHSVAIADAAVLAGAMELPEDPAGAIAYAEEYAAKNAPDPAVAFSCEFEVVADDTLLGRCEGESPTAFLPLVGVDSFLVGSWSAAQKTITGRDCVFHDGTVDDREPPRFCVPRLRPGWSWRDRAGSALVDDEPYREGGDS